MDIGGTTREWWLRSPGDSSTQPVADVNANGSLNYSPATFQGSNRGFRPALWVRL
jgi:hypothetical protein